MVQMTSDPNIKTATFSVAANGSVQGAYSTPLFYQWERSGNGGVSWAKIAGANSSALQVVVSTQDGGAMFRVAVSVPGKTVMSSAATVDVAVNNPPSFTLAGATVTANPGPQTVPAWVLNISPGPEAWEAAQAVSFIVTVDNAALFAVPPAIDAAGTLTFTAAAEGAALVTVVAKDNGGTAFGGQDTSMPKTFTIQIVVPVCPVALPQTVTVTEGQSVDIMLMADNAAGAAWAVSSPPLHGALSGTAPALTYTPAPTYCGPDSFTFTVSKAGARSAKRWSPSPCAASTLARRPTRWSCRLTSCWTASSRSSLRTTPMPW